MSQQNVSLVQSLYAEFGKGNIAGILAQLTDDVHWQEFDNKDIPYAGARSGKSEVEQFFQSISSTINVSAFEPREFIEAGDKVVVLGQWAGTVKATNKNFTSRWAMVWTIANGKVKKFDCYEDTASTAAAFKK